MIFNDHAASVGVADIQNQIDWNRRGTQGMGNKFDFRDGDLLAKHGHQIEPVRLVFKPAQRLMQVALGAVFHAGSVARKGFAQPAINPGLIEETQHFIVAPGQRKTGAVEDVIFDRRQARCGVIGNLAVERKGYTMGIACAVRRLKLAYLRPRPVIRAVDEGTWRIKA
ncbi:hypothetical protein D3C72_390130 [compost metagenome]